MEASGPSMELERVLDHIRSKLKEEVKQNNGCEVRFSNKGWLLVTKSPTSILFFQPFTRTRIQVPDLRQMEAFAFRAMKAIHIGWHIGCSASRYLGKSRRRFLIWYKEEQISVFVDQGRGTHAVKLDKRVPLKRLEKEIMYSSQTTCLVVQGKEQKIKNTVQMSMFLDNEKYQVYKREGGWYSQISHLYHTREFLSAAWVQPLLLPRMLQTF
ncbi:hypothetical protein J1N35_032340 [Gossypium stocksii]|uniref:Uncharacterized protein n=1 Tax=Gossypium stocksii TaxID=47602 RepID=A0A9D3V333_9ROSI|nr:hypothetical protein J1N35_032340 [Gossypium stocksii]